MAAPMEGLKPHDITRCLKALASMNVQDITSADIISDLVNENFITRPTGNDDSGSDLSKSSDDDPEIGPEVDLDLDLEVNGSANGV